MRHFIEKNTELMFKTLKELCTIPAPSHQEHKRAAYCKAWLEKAGADGVYTDKALNVIFPLNCAGSDKITVFAAHTDTVFPDTEPMPYADDGERIYCPGVGDDTASLTVLLILAKYFIEKQITPPHGILFVCNSCEEGLGNLKGVRRLFEDYKGRIDRFITFDSQLDRIVDRCVGSHRYDVTVLTEGGHSFSKFGNANAIHELSKIVSSIYSIQVPQKENCRTTYNVGCISGGTSVNTIAQRANMLCEYRSDDRECLSVMQNKFEKIFDEARSEYVQVSVNKIGERPCGNIDNAKLEPLRQILKPLIEEVIGMPVCFECGSTDCNIPLSMGIPAVSMGVYFGGGAHTREEWIEKSSLIPGLEVAIKAAARLTGCAI